MPGFAPRAKDCHPTYRGVVEDSHPDLVVASVSHETGVSFLTSEHPALRFGRSSTCEVRFGHQPLFDQVVPRVAGHLVDVGRGRIGVENLSDRVAFDVKTPDGPLEAVRPGALLSPTGLRFQIHVIGQRQRHVLQVHLCDAPVAVDLGRRKGVGTEAATCIDPELTERQWDILDLYALPLRAGGTVPSTHGEVAHQLHWSLSLVRVECHEIWSEFVLAGVPMRDFPDKRDAIVDAAVRHQLSRPGDRSQRRLVAPFKE